jgi:3-dehydrosphinganine reductase
MLEETNDGQSAEFVARKSIQGLENGHELVTSDIQTRFVLSTIFGASRRGGLFRTLVD